MILIIHSLGNYINFYNPRLTFSLSPLAKNGINLKTVSTSAFLRWSFITIFWGCPIWDLSPQGLQNMLYYCKETGRSKNKLQRYKVSGGEVYIEAESYRCSCRGRGFRVRRYSVHNICDGNLPSISHVLIIFDILTQKSRISLFPKGSTVQI